MHTSPIRWKLLGAATLAASVLAPTLLRAQAPGAPAAPRSHIAGFTANQGAWAWIKEKGVESELYTGGPGRQPVLVARGSGWTELALSGGECWILSRGAGTLLRSSLQPNSTPEVVLSRLSSPGGLHVAGSTLFWLEAIGSPTLAFVPSAGPRLSVRSRGAGGQVQTLGEWPGSRAPAGLPESGDVIGVAADSLYLRVRRSASTEFVRFRLPAGGVGERVAAELSQQQGLLHDGRLYWTAPSEEAPFDTGIRSIRRLTATGAAETLTDWMPGAGSLVELNGSACIAATRLYRLPSNPAPAELTGHLPFGALTGDGTAVISLEGPDAPRAVSGKKE